MRRTASASNILTRLGTEDALKWNADRNTSCGAKCESPKRAMKEEKWEKWNESVLESRGKVYKHGTTQPRVYVTVSSPWQQFRCFWMGFLIKFGHHSFHYHFYNPLWSLGFLHFNPIRNPDPQFTHISCCRKAWCCTWKRDFWQSHTPMSRNLLAHSWIFFCCSGTYGYVTPRAERWRSLLVHHSVLCILTKVSLLVCSPLPLRPLTCNKSHIVHVFTSSCSGVCMWLKAKHCQAPAFLEIISLMPRISLSCSGPKEEIRSCEGGKTFISCAEQPGPMMT